MIAPHLCKNALPRYAVDLLHAAKLVAHPPINAMPELLAHYQRNLLDAVAAFERAMPVVDGVIGEHHIEG
ncbi:hypothetical protein [Ralstonia solanacearum]|uniref:hypothetical protein n=1 Tax=Ralstonia solanacearum TaxID=305 RepID=UPI001FFAC689